MPRREDHVCHFCNRIGTLEYLPRYELYVCPICKESHFFICEECGQLTYNRHERFLLIEDNLRKRVCKDCKSNYPTCNNCGRDKPNKEIKQHNAYYYCKDCWSEDKKPCANCDTLWNKNSFITFKIGEEEFTFCPICYERNVVQCDHCATNLWKYSSCIYTQPNGISIYICNNCHRLYYSRCRRCESIYLRETGPTCSCGNLSFLNEHDFRPKIMFHSATSQNIELITQTNSPDNLYLGFELEVIFAQEQGLSEFLGWVNNFDPLMQHLWCKYDGSLDEYKGCEVVSQPMTLDYHNHNNMWVTIINKIKRIGAISHNDSRCGLHIHANRSFFAKTDIVRVMKFTDKFERELCALGRRGLNRYCEGFKRLMSHDFDVTNPKWRDYIHFSNTGISRYCAINTISRDTIEFRFPRGTLNLDTLFATLQLIDGIVRYCKSISSLKLEKSEWRDFKEYLHRQRYKKLIQYCKLRKV